MLVFLAGTLAPGISLQPRSAELRQTYGNQTLECAAHSNNDFNSFEANTAAHLDAKDNDVVWL